MDYTIITIDGNSMEPIYKSNMKVLLKQNVNNYNVGDVVVYYQNNKMIIHRIIQIVDNKLAITKGDNNLYADKTVRVSKIIGKVIDNLDRSDKQSIAIYSKLVAIVVEKYGNSHRITQMFFHIFTKYLEVKFKQINL